MGNVSIRKAEKGDFPAVLAVYDAARKYMRENGNPTQWGMNHPSESLLRADAEKGQLYVIEENGDIHGVFAFIVGDDPTYKYIENGSWLSESEYGTLHRVASDCKVKNVFGTALEYCENTLGVRHIRVDTHENNLKMRHCIEKNGFSYRGIIYIPSDGTPRFAYEKI